MPDSLLESPSPTSLDRVVSLLDVCRLDKMPISVFEVGSISSEESRVLVLMTDRDTS